MGHNSGRTGNRFIARESKLCPCVSQTFFRQKIRAVVRITLQHLGLRQYEWVCQSGMMCIDNEYASDLVYFTGRVVHEVTLTNSIRYANGDAIEQWLYDLLCLDVTDLPPLTGETPDPASCDLYYINRDTLFSYDRSAETFLKHLVNLYVSSHYKVFFCFVPYLHCLQCFDAHCLLLQ